MPHPDCKVFSPRVSPVSFVGPHRFKPPPVLGAYLDVTVSGFWIQVLIGVLGLERWERTVST